LINIKEAYSHWVYMLESKDLNQVPILAPLLLEAPIKIAKQWFLDTGARELNFLPTVAEMVLNNYGAITFFFYDLNGNLQNWGRYSFSRKDAGYG